ncbi:MAG: hypothetical protein LBH25_05325 [Fibromonadaceae bacterium]|jgi:hypothetical protein|nr:hypothetical protein [Fibromonadaceae bacterium]
MNKSRILILLCLSLAGLMFFSCSDNKDDGGGGTGKWCVYISTDWEGMQQKKCGEIGATLEGPGYKYELTEDRCKNNYDDPSIEDEKPDDCEVTTK